MLHEIYSFLTQTHGHESVFAVAPLVWAAIMAAANGVKAATSDKQQADNERAYEAETARWSPWTGLKSHYVANPSVTNAALQGGLSGYAFGQNLESANQANKTLSEAAEERARDRKMLDIYSKYLEMNQDRRAGSSREDY